MCPAGVPNLDLPLMRNNITAEDLAEVRQFLAAEPPPILTQSQQVAQFEREWSDWLGVRYSVFVNSGSSANLITLAALRWLVGPGEVIVPPLTWVSDIVAVLLAGFEPVFVDIDRRTLGLDTRAVIERLSPRTKAVFPTHVLGYNALTDELLDELRRRGVPLIEDVCEAHGATFRGNKLGTQSLMSNFSFYYAHHMSTIEGGMVSTDDPACYERLRMLRSHGMVREASQADTRAAYQREFPDLNPDFIFAYPAFNVRSTEINAVIGRSQLRRLDRQNERRREHLQLFLARLDPSRYRTDFAVEGSCNYAFTLVLNEPNEVLRDNCVAAMRAARVEFRRGLSGGGNQLRQPYLQGRIAPVDLSQFPQVEHVHFFGFYIGNFPDLEPARIEALCALLNGMPADRRWSP
ncbi:MAG: DegT/DnrJ/EryC1/StrS family aminotransferase [Pirellulales bacterium]|nr:DegT/DnrJ/EryC1/StrS family aminotransferase [Pirellulales bacterium]